MDIYELDIERANHTDTDINVLFSSAESEPELPDDSIPEEITILLSNCHETLDENQLA